MHRGRELRDAGEEGNRSARSADSTYQGFRITLLKGDFSGETSMGWNKGLTALAALGLAFSARPVLAEGQLHGVGKFMNGDSEVDVDTFSNVNAQGKEVRVGLLSILSNHKVISVTFDKTEMPALTRLWQSALGKQSPNWQPVGDYTETGTTDVSHLTVSAGPGVRFVIESPALGAFTSELAPSNFDRFGAALQSAESYVEAQEQ